MAVSDEPIETEEQLRVAVREASYLIQMAHDFVKANPAHNNLLKLRFPRGFLPPASRHRQKLAFIGDATLKANVSYALMTHDVLRWLFVHTDISGQAQEMLIKEAVCLVGNICESLSLRPNHQGLGRKSSFKQRIARYLELEVIDQKTHDDLVWLWDKRNQEHLADVPFKEWSHYSTTDWTRSIRAYKGLRDALMAKYAPA